MCSACTSRPETVYGLLIGWNGVLIVLTELPLTSLTLRFDARRVMALGYVLRRRRLRAERLGAQHLRALDRDDDLHRRRDDQRADDQRLRRAARAGADARTLHGHARAGLERRGHPRAAARLPALRTSIRASCGSVAACWVWPRRG